MTAETPRWEDPYSPEGKREATSKILTGMNYRLFYEGVTRRKLISTYKELADLARQHSGDDEAWKESIRKLVSEPGKGKERQVLRRWLIGLTQKTAVNLEVKASEYLAVFDQMMLEIERHPSNIKTRDMALLFWSGAATLTIRGSRKATTGKALEKSITRAALTIIGLREEAGEFRLDLEADEEVDRQTDAEIRTPRGYVRMEIGLIGKGNPEVIGDKVGRVGRNGVILFDTLPAQSSMWTTAAQHGVKLIQLRNNHPVEELRQHLAGLNVSVQQQPITPEEVEQRVMAIPLQAFDNQD